MKNRILLLVLVGSLAMNAGFAVMLGLNALTRSAEHLCPFTASDEYLYAFLGLSDKQLSTIEPLAQSFHRQMETVLAKVANSKNRLIDEMAKEEPDLSAIDEIHKDIFTNQSEVQRIVLAHIMDMKKVFNREQRDKFFQSMRQNFPVHQ